MGSQGWNFESSVWRTVSSEELMNGFLGQICAQIGETGPEIPTEDGEMTLPTRRCFNALI